MLENDEKQNKKGGFFNLSSKIKKIIKDVIVGGHWCFMSINIRVHYQRGS